MSCGIYKITNNINNKSYIGQSINIERRWREHKNLKIIDSILKNAFIKYEIKNFSFSILEECDREKLNEKEIFYIKKYNSLKPNGYNIVEGGNNFQKSVKLSKKDVEEIIKLLKNTTLTSKEIAKKFNVNYTTISSINTGTTWKNISINYPIRKANNKKYKKHCLDCGKEITKQSIRCRSCFEISQRKINRPSKEELIKELKETNFVQTGKRYNVSDVAIRKWCKGYNISDKAKDYK